MSQGQEWAQQQELLGAAPMSLFRACKRYSEEMRGTGQVGRVGGRGSGSVRGHANCVARYRRLYEEQKET